MYILHPVIFKASCPYGLLSAFMIKKLSQKQKKTAIVAEECPYPLYPVNFKTT